LQASIDQKHTKQELPVALTQVEILALTSLVALTNKIVLLKVSKQNYQIFAQCPHRRILAWALRKHTEEGLPWLNQKFCRRQVRQGHTANSSSNNVLVILDLDNSLHLPINVGTWNKTNIIKLPMAFVYMYMHLQNTNTHKHEHELHKLATCAQCNVQWR
jgi:hypothetical protein